MIPAETFTPFSLDRLKKRSQFSVIPLRSSALMMAIFPEAPSAREECADTSMATAKKQQIGFFHIFTSGIRSVGFILH